ncbi:MAG TPA: hypothetical protein DCS44_02005 [Cyanobacteria bacterium UBA10660]|nr:MAG TPA: hypothetical protein CPT83_00165 [Candidatus Gastranaerophilales bacterium HUM_1]HAS93374.1 hypothetical protein [Cyanobacteria bacterium UBA10660]
MKRLNKAFTLTELLVALGVIGILCAILLPIIFNIMPNKSTIMAKRVYYTVQTVVSDLINDEACYPDLTSASDTEKRVGFDDGFGYPNCSAWGGTEHTETIDTEGDPNVKFKTLFLDKLGKTDIDTAQSNTTFATADGVEWAIHTMGYGTKNNKNVLALITVDTNGKSSPNCDQAAVATGASGSYSNKIAGAESCNGRKKGFDRFTMAVYADGKIKINENDTWAINAIQVDRNITGDGTSNDNDNKL